MYEILEKNTIRKELKRCPTEVLKKYELWKDIVMIQGPETLREIKGFHDESLAGVWKGFRSSRLNKRYRVIYKVEKKEVLVLIEKITPHEYRRKK